MRRRLATSPGQRPQRNLPTPWSRSFSSKNCEKIHFSPLSRCHWHPTGAAPVSSIAKAKAIEEQAEKEYAIRIDQARYAAEGIYTETAERITGVVDTAVNNNMDRIYNLLDEFIYSKTLPGRVNSFVNNCKAVAQKVKEAPAKAAAKVKAVITEKLNAKKAPVEAAE